MKVLKKEEYHLKWFHGRVVDCPKCKSQMELSTEDTPKSTYYDCMCGNSVSFDCPVCGHELYEYQNRPNFF